MKRADVPPSEDAALGCSGGRACATEWELLAAVVFARDPAGNTDRPCCGAGRGATAAQNLVWWYWGSCSITGSPEWTGTF